MSLRGKSIGKTTIKSYVTKDYTSAIVLHRRIARLVCLAFGESFPKTNTPITKPRETKEKCSEDSVLPHSYHFN